MSNSETDLDLSLVPDQPTADDALFDALAGQIKGPHDLLRFQMAEVFVREVDVRRKEQNKRLLALKRSWEQKKGALRDQLLALLDKEGEGEGHKRKLKTILGTTYRQWRGEWKCKITDEDDAIEWLVEQHREQAHEEGWIEMVPKLTAKGREAVEHMLIERCKATGETEPFCDVQGPGYSVASRLGKLSDRREISETVARSLLAIEPNSKETTDE